jgi:hypothetical protein
MSADFEAYRDLARAVCADALREDACAFARSEAGRFWLAWLGVDADALLERIERRSRPQRPLVGALNRPRRTHCRDGLLIFAANKQPLACPACGADDAIDWVSASAHFRCDCGAGWRVGRRSA